MDFMSNEQNSGQENLLECPLDGAVKVQTVATTLKLPPEVSEVHSYHLQHSNEILKLS